MSVEGIFRKNGNIRRLKELTEAIDRDPSAVDLTQDNPVQLAALLKKFLRDLPDPLMTFKLHKLLIATQSESSFMEQFHFRFADGRRSIDIPLEAERMRLLHMVALILPKAHRDTMEVLFVFLKWVASFAHMDEETGSKMDLGNLATVICPSILYARGRDAVRDDSFGAIRVVTTLLEHQDEFFQVPIEFLPILVEKDHFSNSMDLPSKDFMRKCDTYMRMKPNGRPPLLTTPSNSGQLGGGGARSPLPVPQSSERLMMMGNTSNADSSRSLRQPQPGMSPPLRTNQTPPGQQPRNENEGPNASHLSPSLRPMSWQTRPGDDQSYPYQLIPNGPG